VDDPRIAYLSLIAPEMVCAIWIWRQLSTVIPLRVKLSPQTIQ
jgi:hypothetical protein